MSMILADFCSAYPIYVAHLPDAQMRLHDEMRNNSRLRDYLQECQLAYPTPLPELLQLPERHLREYPVLLERIMQQTEPSSPDIDSLVEAINLMRRLSTLAVLRTVQAKGHSPKDTYVAWHDLVSQEEQQQMSKQEIKRQACVMLCRDPCY